MPRIPISNRRIGISQVVQGVEEPVSGAGQSFRQIAQVGSDIAQLGAKLAEKRSLAKEADFANKQSVADSLTLSELEKQMKLQYESNPEGYAQAFTQKVNELRQKSIGAAPSARSKQMYAQRFSSLYDTAIIKAHNFENVQTVRVFHQNMVNSQEGRLRGIVDSPDPEWAISHMQGNAEVLKGEGVKGTLLSDMEVEEEIKGFNNKAVKALLGGYEAKRDYGSALRVLNDKRFSDNLSPAELASYKSKFAEKVKTRQRERKADTLWKISNDIKFAEMGGKISQADYERNLMEIRNNSQFTDTEKMRYIGEYSLAKVVGEMADDLYDNPRAKWGEVQKQVGAALESLPKEVREDSTFHALLKSKGQETFEKLRAGVIKRQNEDAMAVTLSRNEELVNLSKQAGHVLDPSSGPPEIQARRQFLREAKAYQQERGMPIRVATKEEAKNLASTIKNLPNAQARANAVEMLKMQYGEDFSLLMDHMTEADKDFGGLSYVGSITDPLTQSALMENVFDKDAIEEAYKRRLDLTLQKPGDLDNKVASAFKDASEAMSAQAMSTHHLAEVNGMAEIVKTEAKKLVASGVSMDKAAKQAVQTVMDRNFFYGDMGGNPDTFLPKNIGSPVSENVARKNIESFFEVYASPPNLAADFDLYLPQRFHDLEKEFQQRQDELGQGRTQEEVALQMFSMGAAGLEATEKTPAESVFYRQVVKNGRWVLDSSKQNLQLVYEEEDGTLIPMYYKGEDGGLGPKVTVPLRQVYEGYNEKTKLSAMGIFERLKSRITGDAQGKPRE